jgi:hypothetical protein
LIAHHGELVALRFDDVLRRLDLGAQRRFGDRRRHHVRCERQIGRLQFEPLILRQRCAGLDLASQATEDVGRVRDVHGGLVEIESLRSSGQAEFRRRELLARGRAVRIDVRQQPAGLGIEVFLGLP